MTAAVSDDRPIGRSLRVALALASRAAHGSIEIVLPDRRRFYFEGPHEGPRATLIINRSRAFRRLLLGGTLGLGEAYMDGDWETPDLPAFLAWGSINEPSMGGEVHYGARLLGAVRRLWHGLRPNTKPGSRRNIAYHYDLGNAFYERWLDPSMTYSSAVFEHRDQPLDAAQRNKYRRMAELLDLRPGHRLLEIGCGWGGFADFVAREFGCRVTAITISREQLDFTRRRIQQRGLGERVEARYVDYRDVDGRFDRIASIEMFEAVGERYWPTFFGKLRDNLAPDGRAALQVITIADSLFDRYRRGADFIQRYIFPGGMLPSPRALRAATGASGFTVVAERFFGADYAHTLALWQERFQRAWPDIAALGYDQRFKRMWEFYLAYCEAGFRAQQIDVVQLALARG